MAPEKTAQPAPEPPVKQLQVPDMIVSPTDINRLLREIETLSDYVQQASIRQSTGAQAEQPQTSYLLQEFSVANKLNLLSQEDCKRAQQFFAALQKSAPVVHVSFAVNPSAAFIAKLVAWFRGNVHAQTLISIGLQPNMAAGCIVRTTNHVFDFSLRRRFNDSRQQLVDRMQEWIKP